MKAITGFSAAALILLASSATGYAIEGLKISVNCPDVLLSWPCLEDGSETFVVRYRQTLATNAPWEPLTSALHAQPGTNMTYFVHANVVTNCGDSSGGMAESGDVRLVSVFELGVPLAAKANGTGAAVPLALYPPGFDLSDFRIFDPAASDWLPWSAYGSEAVITDFPPLPGPGDGDPPTNAPPATGFYQVVRVGVRLFGFTNGMVLTGEVVLPVELGNTNFGSVLSQLYLLSGSTGDTLQGAEFPVIPFDATNGINGRWDTTQLTNGEYQIQLGAELTDGTIYYDRPVTVTIANKIWFPDPFNVGGEAIYIGAQTIYSNGTWHIDIFDDLNRRVGNLDGPIDDTGYCAWPGISGPGFSLDNTDGQGNQNPSAFYTFGIKAMASGNTNLFSLATNKVFIELGWNFAPTKAVTAYMQMFASHEEGWNETISLVQAVYSVQEPFHPNLLGTAQIPFFIQSSGDWGQVTNAFADPTCRDFFYFGHGTNNAIGTGAALLSVPVVQNLLRNNLKNPLVATNMHPFRYVFLNGCNTADGTWPQAFGIPKQKGMVVADFVSKRGIRPRAFMGWDRNKKLSTGIISGAVLNPDHMRYISTYWASWAQRDPFGLPQNDITAAIAAAKAAAINASLGMQLYGAKDLVIDF